MAACLLALFAFQTQSPEARTRVLWGWFDGSVEAGEVSAKVMHGADTIELREDLGFDHVPLLSEEVVVPLSGVDAIDLHALFMDFSQRHRLDDEIVYDDGVAFSPGEKVRADFWISMIHAGYDRGIHSSGAFSLRAGVGLGTHYVSLVITRRRQPPLSDDSSEEVKSLTPYLHLEALQGLGADFDLRFDLKGSPVSFAFYPDEAAASRFIMIEAALSWRPAPWVALEPALDFFWFRGHFHGTEGDGKSTGNNKFDVRFAGPSLGVVLRF